MTSIDPNITAAQRQQLELAEQQERFRLALLQRADDLRFVMGSSDGRRFVYGLLDSANLFGSSFGADAHTSAFLEGRRAFAVELVRQLQSESRDAYVLMISEATQALPKTLAPSTKERLER